MKAKETQTFQENPYLEYAKQIFFLLRKSIIYMFYESLFVHVVSLFQTYYVKYTKKTYVGDKNKHRAMPFPEI